MEQDSSSTLYRFGVFETDKQTGELRKQGRRLTLQGQPLQVLLMLLERPGELVTRIEMQQRIWPDGTFVDFEHGLNTAVNKIRDALGDSAANPRFIETLAKRGYRFIAAVEIANGAKDAFTTPQTAADKAVATPQAAPINRHLLTRPEDVPLVSQTLARALLLVLQMMYLCFYIVTLARLRAAEEVMVRILPGHFWTILILVIAAAAGIPTRLYLLSLIAFRSPSLRNNFLRLFPVIFPFDALWALAPFLLIDQIGFGLALAATAALLYAPFAQRSLILMASAPAVPPPVPT